jgi:aspartyl-tRNA(Asn)/glutamyl-tRNA(Gln) amidotransferase subunit C
MNKEAIDHLARLARVRLTEEEKDRFAGQLDQILHHFDELKEVETEHVPPMNGGTLLENISRLDDERSGTLQGKGRKGFPEVDPGGFLSVPAVFASEEES